MTPTGAPSARPESPRTLRTVRRVQGSAVQRIVARLLARGPRLGSTSLVCVDGPAGSGKTTLARRLAEHLTSPRTVAVVHMDDLYDGWDALVGGRASALTARVAEDLLAPLSAGRPGSHLRYDWPTGAFADVHRVAPVDVLVVEGCASAQSSWAAATTVAVWVEVPRGLRTRRWLARDDDPRAAEQCRAWQRDEDAWFAADGTRARADVLVDGATG